MALHSEEAAKTTSLSERLNAIAGNGTETWSYLDRVERDYVHTLFQYPAMMVPQMQRQLMDIILDWDPTIRKVYDPFTGSGTVMTEAMLKGLDFFGTDINPLAILVARAKSGSFDVDLLRHDLDTVLSQTASSSVVTNPLDFPNIRKWFEPHVIEGLSLLRNAITSCEKKSSRCFWWVALAETIRLTSNSRTSTVKLHIRPLHERLHRANPIPVFLAIAKRNLRVLEQQQEYLCARGLLHESRYTGIIRLRIDDAKDAAWDQQCDLMVTSPPYGDNHTTVTYGQASYLPLQWIDRTDIGELDSDSCISNTHSIDSASLGGTCAKTKKRQQHFDSLLDRSRHLRRVYNVLANEPSDRWARVINFYGDLDTCIDTILENVRTNGIMVWTTGDRTVGGQRIPMAQILEELLGQRIELIAAIPRRIPKSRKRMPSRNSSSNTVNRETVIVARRVG